MERKIYQKTLNRWSWKKIVAQKSMGDDNYRIAVRSGKDVYILSNPCSSGISLEMFKLFENDIEMLERAEMPIKITFIKKFGKKFINEIS